MYKIISKYLKVTNPKIMKKYEVMAMGVAGNGMTVELHSKTNRDDILDLTIPLYNLISFNYIKQTTPSFKKWKKTKTGKVVAKHYGDDKVSIRNRYNKEFKDEAFTVVIKTRAIRIDNISNVDEVIGRVNLFDD